jgi:site-specific recombinase XerD
MKTTDFAKYLSDFMTIYLINERGFSNNTVKAYRDTFVQFIAYMETCKKLSINKFTLADITKENVVAFLNWVETERHCSVSTRNGRLAAIHSFIKYVQRVHPDNLYEFQRVLTIKSKKHNTGKINYLTLEGIKLLLEMPDKSSLHGRRDLALLSLMYDTGCRVQEIADLTVENVNLNNPSFITVKGKGKKIRNVPMLQEQTMILRQYMQENGLMGNMFRLYPLFMNHHREKLTRGGITHILKKYVEKARKANPDIIPEVVSCHSLRHSKAMHLLQGGLNLVYIRDILGHVSIQTTEIYARADSKQKREALEKAYTDVSPKVDPLWEKDKDLLAWLKSF